MTELWSCMPMRYRRLGFSCSQWVRGREPLTQARRRRAAWAATGAASRAPQRTFVGVELGPYVSFMAETSLAVRPPGRLPTAGHTSSTCFAWKLWATSAFSASACACSSGVRRRGMMLVPVEQNRVR